VEDDPDLRRPLQAMLELDGHTVTAVGTGPEALAAIAADRPDVAVVDIGLPGVSGYDVARQVRAEHPSGPPGLVALTGYGQPLDKVAAQAAGFDHHLTKPPSPVELNAVLRAAAEARREQPPVGT
jgi:CheY-like chemotaxis protein